MGSLSVPLVSAIGTTLGARRDRRGSEVQPREGQGLGEVALAILARGRASRGYLDGDDAVEAGCCHLLEKAWWARCSSGWPRSSLTDFATPAQDTRREPGDNEA